jgi:hypothetical protein
MGILRISFGGMIEMKKPTCVNCNNEADEISPGCYHSLCKHCRETSNKTNYRLWGRA